MYILMVYTRPVAGLEDDYHRWYDEIHLAEVLGVPGFTAAQRFGVEQPPGGPPGRYVAMYTIESDDIEATLATFERARAGMRAPLSLDPASVVFALLRPVGPGHRG